MSGIVGLCSHHPLDIYAIDQLLTDMAEQITYTPQARRDIWCNRFLAIARVYHGGAIHSQSQPVFNENGSLCLMMVGEIFDYDSERMRLEEQGHVFRQRRDQAEYCLHLYEQHGTEGFAKLNGTFLVVVYDLQRHELLLANDRFVSYPLFIYQHGQYLAFGTQLRPLLKLPNLPRQLDLQAVWTFFTLQRVPGERTFYQDVKVLPPASVLHFQEGRLSSHRYWQMLYSDEKHSEAYHVGALADAMTKAVTRRTKGGHRLGILLSGGLDSRGILAADREGRIGVAFTLAEFENLELQIARRVAAIKGCKHVFLRRDLDYYVRLLDEAVDIGDGMYRFEHAHFLGVLEQVKEETDALFVGHCMGMLFKGSQLPRRYWTILGQNRALPVLRKLSFDTLPESFLRLSKDSTLPQGVEQLFCPALRGQKEACLEDLRASVSECRPLCGDNVYNAWDYLTGCNSFFKCSISLNLLCVQAHTVARTVAFDNDLFGVYLSLPPQLRLGRVYRKALAKLAPELMTVPYARTGVPPYTSLWWEWGAVNAQGVLRRLGILPYLQSPHPAYAHGPWPRIGELMRHHEPLQRMLEATLHDPTCLAPELFDQKAMETLWGWHRSGQRDMTELLSLLLTFGRWYKRYGPG